MPPLLRVIFRKKSSLFFKLILALGSFVGLLVVFIWLSYVRSTQLSHSLIWVDHTHQVINTAEKTLSKLNECEAGVRGYALTGDARFIRNYAQSQDSIQQWVLRLEDLTSDNQREQARIVAFHQSINQRLAMLNISIALRKGTYQGRINQGQWNEKSRQLMSQIRRDQQVIVADEVRLLQARQSIAQDKLNVATKATLAAGVLGLLVTLLVGLIVRKEIGHSRESEQWQRQLNEQKNRFFSILSHDLRGHQGNAGALLEMLQSDAYQLSPQERNQMLGMVSETVTANHKLLESLLQWGKSQMNQLAYEPSPIKLQGLVSEELAALRPLAEKKHLNLINDVSMNWQVYGDREMIRTAIRNVVSNAIKFTPPHGSVHLSARLSAQDVLLLVEDTGVGMSQQVQASLFEVGSKHSTRGTANEKGTGLGLILCREFIEKNGGSISVESQEGKGSLFKITLPQPS
ncbi:MAG: CHASE3 domain-containing protein [Bacteroidota bacterium]